jgi:mersacidin/lichenicidin family type 2 lantibiotic
MKKEEAAWWRDPDFALEGTRAGADLIPALPGGITELSADMLEDISGGDININININITVTNSGNNSGNNSANNSGNTGNNNGNNSGNNNGSSHCNPCIQSCPR